MTTSVSLHDPSPARDRWMTLMVMIVSAIYYGSYAHYFLNLIDEGFLTYGTVRLLDGQVPLVDYWSYPPGRYLLLAGAFKVFGTHLTVERWLLVALLSLRNGLAYGVSRQFLRLWPALAVTVTIMLVPGPWHKLFYSLPMFISLVCLFDYVRRPGMWRAIGLGVVAAVIFYFRHDYAVYALFVGALAIVGIWWAQPINAQPWWRGVVRDGLAMSVAFAVGLAPLFGYYAIYSDLGRMWQTLGPDTLAATDVVHEFVTFKSIGDLPELVLVQLSSWTSKAFLRAWFPYVAVAVSVAAVIACLRIAQHIAFRRTDRPTHDLMFVLLAAWAVLAAMKIFRQPGFAQVVMGGSGLMIVTAVGVVNLWKWSRQREGKAASIKEHRRRQMIFAAVAAVLAFTWISLLVPVLVPVHPLKTGTLACRFQADEPLVVARAQLMLPRDDAQTLEQLIREVQRRVPQNAPIYAFRQSMLYVLAERDSATSVDVMPAAIAMPHVAERMAAEFRASPPILQLIDLNDGWTHYNLKHFPSDLREVMFQGYRPATRVGRYLLLEQGGNESAWPFVDECFEVARGKRRS